MKTVIHSVMLLIISLPSSFCQRKNNIGNNNITLVNATMQQQVSGANSENSSSTIYNVTFHAENDLVIKKIKGKINGISLGGKIIYSNTISDSMVIRDGDSFIVRFEKYNTQSAPENIDSVYVPVIKKCHSNKKISADSSLIFLSFLAGDKPFYLTVRCNRKIISGDRKLPQ